MNKKIALVFGTRPEIIKMSPFIKELIARHHDFFIIHTGQHYSDSMDKIFWENFSLSEPKYKLGVGSSTHAEQVGKMMIGIEKICMEEKPDCVTVYGDPNSSVAGALVAAKLNIPFVQMEGGLRSYDRTMPEEVNRLVTDRLASCIFAPTNLQKEHLQQEGITNNVFVVGNLISDVVKKMLPIALRASNVNERLGVKKGEYFLATIHRQQAVDIPQNFQNILSGLGLIADAFQLPVIYAIHPRAKKNLETFKLTVNKGVRLIDPVDYFDFMALSAGAKVVLSDSGGIQEETCIMGVPLVTLRENTERQETLTLGSNVLGGFEPAVILAKVKEMAYRPLDWQHPYGSNVAQKMVDILEKESLL
ncbi:MAG: UDP-N-acetylglucosamine 2-epimerase (non-hydrolyzing) [bacterium]|nr:UDP-N-acetylglucosamine 2-epimerase (non-hydrolyzing) [bacterium]